MSKSHPVRGYYPGNRGDGRFVDPDTIPELNDDTIIGDYPVIDISDATRRARAALNAAGEAIAYAAESINAAAIAQATIDSTHIALGGVDRDNLVDQIINEQKIEDAAVTASKISVATLSELADDLGIVVYGKLQNYDGTSYVDLDATGTDPWLKHSGMELRADGSATFAGTLDAVDGVFTGTIQAVDGTFVGTVSATAIVATDLFVAVNPVFEGVVTIWAGFGVPNLELSGYDNGGLPQGTAICKTGTGFAGRGDGSIALMASEQGGGVYPQRNYDWQGSTAAYGFTGAGLEFEWTNVSLPWRAYLYGDNVIIGKNGSGQVTIRPYYTIFPNSVDFNGSVDFSDATVVGLSGGSYTGWNLSAEGGASTSIGNAETVDFSGSGVASVSRTGNNITISVPTPDVSLGTNTFTADQTIQGDVYADRFIRR